VWAKNISSINIREKLAQSGFPLLIMPEEGIEWQEKRNILTFEEIIYLVEIFYDHGVRSFRLTGGEPTIREDFVLLIELMKAKFPDIEISMTTNALRLAELAPSIKKAGLDRLNISLDTLDHAKFEKMTRRDQFDKVIKGIEASIAVGFKEIKINAVSIKEFNDDYASLKKFIDFSEEHDIEVRFIEFMPFTGMNWNNGGFISSETLRQTISQHESLVPLDLVESSTSKIWALRDGKARLGFISSVSESFCNSCNRVRITAEGNFRPCLHNHKEYKLRDLIRKNGKGEEIIKIINTALHEKWKEHPDFLSPKYIPPIDDREMIRIGG
jgi:cyclic pyranopterin phosphate synthase